MIISIVEQRRLRWRTARKLTKQIVNRRGFLALICSACCCIHVSSAAVPDTVDPRLRTPVSIHIRAGTLTDMAAEFSRVTGIETSVAANLPPIKVSVFVRKFPVYALQSRLAETLHLSWRLINPDAPASAWAYELYRSKADESEQHRLLERSDTAFRKGIEEFLTAQGLSGEELERLTSQNPVLASAMDNPAQRAAGKVLSLLDAGQLDRLFQGKKLSISTQGGDSPLQRAANSLFDAYRTQTGGGGTSDPARGWVTLGFRISEGSVNRSIIVDLTGPWEARSSSLYNMTSSAAFADLYDDQRSAPDYAAARKSVQITSGVYKKNLAEMLEWLADTLGVNVVAESYRLHNTELDRTASAGTQTIEGLFDSICVGDERWWKRGSCYMLQHKYWFSDREYLVSEALVKHLKETMKRRPVALEDLAELGTLLPQQWLTLQGLGVGEFDQALSLQPLLALYVRLPSAQQKRIFNRGGVKAGALKKADMGRLLHWIQAAGGVQGELNDDTLQLPLRLTATVEQDKTTFRVLAERNSDGPFVLVEQSVNSTPRSNLKGSHPNDGATH